MGNAWGRLVSTNGALLRAGERTPSPTLFHPWSPAAGLAGLSWGGAVRAAKWKFNREVEEALFASGRGGLSFTQISRCDMQICSLHEDPDGAAVYLCALSCRITASLLPRLLWSPPPFTAHGSAPKRLQGTWGD